MATSQSFTLLGPPWAIRTLPCPPACNVSTGLVSLGTIAERVLSQPLGVMVSESDWISLPAFWTDEGNSLPHSFPPTFPFESIKSSVIVRARRITIFQNSEPRRGLSICDCITFKTFTHAEKVPMATDAPLDLNSNAKAKLRGNSRSLPTVFLTP